MSKQEFNPTNALEQSLLDAKRDPRAMADFFDQLLKSEVYVLATGPAGPASALDSSGNLCVLTNASGKSVVPAFTTREKAAPWHERQPQFEYGLLVSASSLLAGLGTDVGLVLNPGHPVGVEIPAEAIKSLAQQPPASPSAH